jgi:site-specific DNA-methyltransferase (adenine-specific)
MCSYHGMFPAKLAHYFIQSYSQTGDLVLDPFSGRGTVPLQSRIEGRRTIGNDLNPLGYVLSSAKARVPSWSSVHTFLEGLERQYNRAVAADPDVSNDIRMLFHPNTLRQICYIRQFLHRRSMTRWTPEELMVAGSLAGIMHGKHRRDGSSQYLSISMPNTFSMSPTYVAKYIKENGLTAPNQNIFERIRDKLARLYLDAIDGPEGETYAQDASEFLAGGPIEPKTVDLVITSPPYLQVVNYGTANWIRLWLLGIDEVGRERGAGRQTLNQALDHGHTYTSYRKFLLRTLNGIERVLREGGVAAIVVGDVAGPGKDPVPLAGKIWEDVGASSGLRLLHLIEDYLPVQNKVSRIWGDTRGQATNRVCVLVLTTKGGEPMNYSSQVDWNEQYKDGGPDAAHARLRGIAGSR